MTLQEIKAAVDAGRTVYWKNEAYTVVVSATGNYLILCVLNYNAIGLTWRDGVTMNGKEEDFYELPRVA